MGKLATVIAAPIKGALGNDVNVGDTVMVVTTGYSHRVNVQKGKYVGYIQSGSDQRARIEVDAKRYVQIKPDGTEFNWSKDYHRDTWQEVQKTLVRKEIAYTRKSTLQLNRIATIKEADYAIVEQVGKLV